MALQERSFGLDQVTRNEVPALVGLADRRVLVDPLAGDGVVPAERVRAAESSPVRRVGLDVVAFRIANIVPIITAGRGDAVRAGAASRNPRVLVNNRVAIPIADRIVVLVLPVG